MRQTTDPRRTSHILVWGLILALIGLLTFAATVNWGSDGNFENSLAPAYVLGSVVSAAVWLTGVVLIGHAVGQQRGPGATDARTGIWLIGTAPVAFIAAVILSFAGAVPVFAGLASGAAALGLLIAGVIYLALSAMTARTARRTVVGPHVRR